MAYPFPTGYKRQQEYEDDDEAEYDSEMDDFIEDEGSFRKKYPNTFRKSVAMTENNTKMKMILPYITWRVVGKNSKRKKQRV
jgi:hypothetical protein